MKKFQQILRIALSLLIIGVTITSLMAQDMKKVYTLSPWVGAEIDAREMQIYGLFPELKKKAESLVIYVNDKEMFYIIAKTEVGEEVLAMKSKMEIQDIEAKLESRLSSLIAAHKKLEQKIKNGEEDIVVRLMSKDETRIVGSVVGLSTSHIMLDSDLGEISMPLEKITEINFEGEDFQANYIYGFENPNSTRYLFAPSAIPLKKGEGYYQNVWVSVNSINYGLSDHVTISGGLELISTFSAMTNDWITPIGFVNLKVGTQVKEKLHIGGGAIVAGAPGEGGLGIGYGLLTTGSKERNFTVGAGYGANLSEAGEGAGVLMLGGMSRMNRRIALVTENWIVTTSNKWDRGSNRFFGIAMSGGLRIMSEKISFDLALVTLGSIESSTYEGNTNTYTDWLPIPLPYLDLVYHF